MMADITYHEKSQPDPNASASEDTVIEVLRKSIDKRRQALDSYPADHPNRSTLQSEIDLISSYLPTTLEPAAITQILKGIVEGLNETERKDRAAVGKVLATFWDTVKKGQVEDKKVLGKQIGELLRKVQL